MENKKFKFAALSGGYMLSSMIGIIVSIFYVYKKSADWAITFTIIFGIMFVASVISMSVADPDEFVKFEEKTNPTRRKKKSKNKK